jgi:hypothetical protein
MSLASFWNMGSMVRSRLSRLVALSFLAACSFDPSGGSGAPADAGPADAASDGAVNSASHLLLTEVKVVPDSLEFIEIYNPTCADVDLSTYYLTDVPSYPLLPIWDGSPPNPGLLNAVVRFPAGEVLASGAVTVVARDGLAFAGAFGAVPRFALINPGEAAPMEFVAYRSPPDMTIVNGGEPIALFEWDGAQDLVRDVDVVVAGEAPEAERQLIAKQDLAPGGVDGPDDDVIVTQYLADDASLPPMAERESGDGSYQRVSLETGFEIETGGNGIEAHDETSEDTRMTWEQAPGSAPTPGDVPEPLRASCIGGRGAR